MCAIYSKQKSYLLRAIALLKIGLLCNGSEIWQRQPLEEVQHQHRRHDILREANGPTRQALESGCGDSPSKAFKVYMNAESMNIIVRHTNEEARRHDENWQDTDIEELYVFLGLMILAGVYHAKNEAIVQLWSKDHDVICGSRLPATDTSSSTSLSELASPSSEITWYSISSSLISSSTSVSSNKFYYRKLHISQKLQ